MLEEMESACSRIRYPGTVRDRTGNVLESSIELPHVIPVFFTLHHHTAPRLLVRGRGPGPVYGEVIPRPHLQGGLAVGGGPFQVLRQVPSNAV
jgi:hypothetical protein